MSAAAAALSTEKHLYAMLDRHGEHICYLDIDNARDLLKRGLAKTYGSKKRVYGIQLLTDIAIEETGHKEAEPGRSMSPANYAGARFIFKGYISNGRGYVIVYRLKNLVTTESPEHALLRIMTAPALEASIYVRRTEATEAQRAHDPGRLRRQRQRDIFRVQHNYNFRCSPIAA